MSYYTLSDKPKYRRTRSISLAIRENIQHDRVSLLRILSSKPWKGVLFRCGFCGC